jgi:hypothetical protein
MKTLGIILCGIAAIFTVFGIKRAFINGTDWPEDPSLVASYLVGTFLVPMVLLIVGLVLLNKSKQR